MRVLRSIAILLVALGVGFPSRSGLTIEGGSPEDRSTVSEAVARFAELPGQLPKLRVSVLDETSCDGHAGLFKPGTGSWNIDLCQVAPMVVLHELAHAWTKVQLTEADRTAYIRRWGLETWNSVETPWRERGSEHAADAIAWGLLTHRIQSYRCDGPIADQLAAFRYLTGMDSPRVAETEIECEFQR